jgi:hypothetical protein
VLSRQTVKLMTLLITGRDFPPATSIRTPTLKLFFLQKYHWCSKEGRCDEGGRVGSYVVHRRCIMLLLLLISKLTAMTCHSEEEVVLTLAVFDIDTV